MFNNDKKSVFVMVLADGSIGLRYFGSDSPRGVWFVKVNQLTRFKSILFINMSSITCHSASATDIMNIHAENYFNRE